MNNKLMKHYDCLSLGLDLGFAAAAAAWKWAIYWQFMGLMGALVESCLHYYKEKFWWVCNILKRETCVNPKMIGWFA